MSSKAWAADLARALLEKACPARYEHVVGVAAVASDICAKLELDDGDVVTAAWLHDVGYAPEALATGLHALDGARYARQHAFNDQVTRLIAHHSCARVEAELRGLLADLMSEFCAPDRRLAQILTAADMSVGPSGIDMSIDDRLADIRQRYSPDDVVHRFIDLAEADLRSAHAEVQRWLAQSQ